MFIAGIELFFGFAVGAILLAIILYVLFHIRIRQLQWIGAIGTAIIFWVLLIGGLAASHPAADTQNPPPLPAGWTLDSK